jgi:hypothetical protein
MNSIIDLRETPPEEAALDPEINVKDLYDYCMAEILKEKYAGGRNSQTDN